MTEYSIEIYKADKRRKDGKRFIEVVEVEMEAVEGAEIVAHQMTQKDPKLSYKIYKTYNDVRNIMSGKIVQEHYKTPYSCSVGSETYFSS